MDLISQRICMTKDIGVNGNMFGCVMLSIIDEAAAVFACRACDTPRMVTLKMTEVLFKKGVKSGMNLSIYGKIIKIGTTSITLKIEVRKHSPRTGIQEVVCETEMTFVHIDEWDQAVPIQSKGKKRMI